MDTAWETDPIHRARLKGRRAAHGYCVDRSCSQQLSANQLECLFNSVLRVLPTPAKGSVTARSGSWLCLRKQLKWDGGGCLRALSTAASLGALHWPLMLTIAYRAPVVKKEVIKEAKHMQTMTTDPRAENADRSPPSQALKTSLLHKIRRQH